MSTADLIAAALVCLFLGFFAVHMVRDRRQFRRDQSALREEQRQWWAQFGDDCATDAKALRSVVEGCPRCTARLDALLSDKREAHEARVALRTE